MPQIIQPGIQIPIPQGPSPLDVMQDGHEYESILNHTYSNLDIVKEIRRSIGEVQQSRNNTPLICYVANVLNGGIGNSIDGTDDMPFREMVASLPADKTEIDIVLVTSGGLANQVVNFVNVLRPRFTKVSFILLDMAMSAGSIFIMSGDEIIMSKQSKFGPIDPQVPGKDGRYVPAQSILLAINEIQVRGQKAIDNHMQPNWTDVQMLKNIDMRDVGSAIGASNYSIQITKEYLEKYKFSTWTNHLQSGYPVTPQERKDKAEQIAGILCDHGKWKSHGHFIDRNTAWTECGLKIIHSESIQGLDRAMRRMWALFYWLFESTPILKFFISDNYCIIRQKQIIKLPVKP